MILWRNEKIIAIFSVGRSLNEGYDYLGPNAGKPVLEGLWKGHTQTNLLSKRLL